MSLARAMQKQQAEVQTGTLMNALIQHPNVQKALKETIKEMLVLGKIEKPLTVDGFAMGETKKWRHLPQTPNSFGFCAIDNILTTYLGLTDDPYSSPNEIHRCYIMNTTCRPLC